MQKRNRKQWFMAVCVVCTFVFIILSLRHKVKFSIDNFQDFGEIPRIVWSYYDHEPPDDILEMIESHRRCLKNFTYNLITKDNISSFIADIPPDFENLPGNNKGDFVKVALVEKYGGFAVDATSWFNSGDAMEYYFSKSAEVKSQLTGIGEPFHPWTMFFGAPRNSYFMKIWAAEEYKAVKMGRGLNAYKESVLEQFPDVPDFEKDIWFSLDLTLDVIGRNHYEEFKKIPMVFVSILDKYSPVRLEMECKEEVRQCEELHKERLEGERMNCGDHWECVKDHFRNDPKVREYPFLKMGHWVRLGRRLNWGKDYGK